MHWSEMTKKALTIMYNAHKNDMDKAGMPYVFHPYQVAQDMDDEATTCAALLHDLIEDHPESWSFEKLRREGFSENIVNALKLLTHEDGEDYLTYVEKLSSNDIARKVKIADLRHNLDASRLGGTKPRKYDLYMEAYKYLMRKHAKSVSSGSAAQERKSKDGSLVSECGDDPLGLSEDDDFFVTEEEVALENGCYIDDDGHWMPIDDDMDDLFCGTEDCDPDEDSEDYPSESDVARENGCYIDEEGDWAPLDDNIGF